MKREDGCAVFSFFYKKMSVKHKKVGKESWI
jgi:hypothetical protein